MKRKVVNFVPDSLILEGKRMDAFVLHFTEYRGDVAHEIRLHLDADWIACIVYQLEEQVKYLETRLDDIKGALRKAGGAQ